jgi:prepilin-type N-terminal cleavage/methylation domain-containing protein
MVEVKNVEQKQQKGFTIIELMFAMALLGFILIFSLTVISQLISTYNRGLSLIQINQAIRQLDNDLSKALKFIGPGSVKINFFKANGERAVDGSGKPDPSNRAIVAGSLCTKDSTYIWNLGGELADDGMPFFSYSNSSTPLRLLRVNTNDKKYCDISGLQDNNRRFKRGIEDVNIVSLLGSQSMVMYADIKTISEESSSQERLLSVHFILSSAGKDFAPMWVENGSGDEKPDDAPIDPRSYHLTCVNTKNKSEFCSFGEFNSIIYMRGQ